MASSYDAGGVTVNPKPQRKRTPRRQRANQKVEEAAKDEEKTLQSKTQPRNWEHLDHTADVQLHAWGDSLERALEQLALSMFGCMTELDTVRERKEREIKAEGHDMLSLVFAFLDEFLFVFSTEDLVCCRVEVTRVDRKAWTICAVGFGETFDLKVHPQDTEVKAITYSNMQVLEKKQRTDIFVIVDI